MLHMLPHKPRPPTWREVMAALEDTHETLCRVLLLSRIQPRARDELRAMLTDRVRPVLDREGRGPRAIPERAGTGHPRNIPRRLRHLSPEQLSDYRLFMRKGFRAAEALAIATAERPQPLPGNALADAAGVPSASADPT